jgi:tetratricopeptide (TPR) repeat protein
MLSMELKVVRGPRRLEVQRRLAIIKHDQGDPTGALELLGPVVSADPGDDNARGRFVEISLSLNQPGEAARLLTRALGAAKDPAVRARVNADVGTVYLRSGDNKRAEAALRQVVEDGQDASAVLNAARQLIDVYEKAGDQRALASALEAIAKNETESEARNNAARRLARLAEGELADPTRAAVAWRALVDSPWADEALRKLHALYDEAGDWDGMVDVTERRAARAKDVSEAQALAFQAAELRTQKTRDRGAALGAWRAYVARFGPSRDAFAQMIPLLEQEKQWKELAWVLEHDLEQAAPEERVVTLNRLAQLRLSRLDDARGALDAWQKALAVDPSDKPSRAAVDKLLGTGQLRLEAAEVLEHVFRNEEPGTGLLRVLETRAELMPDPAARLRALEEAIGLAGGALSDPLRALELAGQGLEHALAHHPEAAGAWLARVQSHGAEAGKPKVWADVLMRPLGNRPVTSPELLLLAKAAGDVLVQNSEIQRAIEVFRRALEYDPGSSELLTRVDELLALSGSPEERLTLYHSALERNPAPPRKRELLHAVARLQQNELKNPSAAVQTWQLAIADDGRDPVAHEALVEIYGRARDWGALYAELERVLDLHEGERRNATLLAMAETAAEFGDATRALGHYRDLLTTAELGDATLENIELLASANADAEMMRTVLERRIAVASAPEDRANLLEKLGLVQAKQLADPEAAAESWMSAGKLFDAAGFDDRAKRSYERVLGVAPTRADAARRLIELYASAGAWERVPEAFGVVLRGGTDERDVVALLLSLEKPALDAGAVEVFVDLTDGMLTVENLEAARHRQVLLARARALSGNPVHKDEVANIYRKVLELGGDDAHAVSDAFNLFLAGAELTPARVADRRWLFEWRARRATDPTTVLLAWAVAEETTLESPGQAMELYKRVLEKNPDQLDALNQLARLQASHGDADGALASLTALRDRSEGEQRMAVELKLAALLIETLSRPLEALDNLKTLLDATPQDPEVLRLVRAALAFDESQREATVLLERVAEAAPTPEQRAEVLTSLLEVSEGVAELAESRGRWFQQLLECKEGDPEAALAIALRGAEERPGHSDLWDAAERIARKTNQPEPVADAYARALDRDLSADDAEELGRRMVEFHEEWFEDPERVIRLLERVLALSPGASWAFDRLKLAFNASARWNELFSLYDRALERDGEDKLELLREAAMAAKDFANDADRAIDYLERLDRLAPGDARIESSLERLYEREGRARPLIDLLMRRLENTPAHARAELLARITGLWLDAGDPIEAYKLLEQLMKEPSPGVDSHALLERLVALPAAAESIAPSASSKQRKKAVKSVRHAAATLLRKRYEEAGDKTDVARMLEVELELADTKEERVRRLQEIIALRAADIGDLDGAFESTAQLVALEPDEPAHRERFAELAKRTRSEARRADLLATIADGATGDARVSLLLEAARVQKSELGDAPAAIELYQRVLSNAEDRDSALTAARELDPLLETAGRAEERLGVLEQLAGLEPELEDKKRVLGSAARVAGRVLGNWPRSIAAWRARLELDAADMEALDGWCDALAAAGDWNELVTALDVRADKQTDPEARRRDRVGVAQIQAGQIGDLDRAIEAWLKVRADFGKDRESYEALRELLAQSKKYADLAELTQAEAEAEEDPVRRRTLLLLLGEVHKTHTLDLERALDAFIRAKDWQKAREVAAAGTERELSQSLIQSLFSRSVEAWQGSSDGDAGGAADWALDELIARLSEEGEHARVLARLLEGKALPFAKERRRALLRAAACLAADQLGEPVQASELFKELFEDDPADEIAQSSVTRYALLLEDQNLHDRIAGLWEEQARCRAQAGEAGAAAALWARAAEIAEERANDISRAIADHEKGAELGGMVSLEALARIHEARNDAPAAAMVLERLCELSSRDELATRALRLAEAWLRAGQPARARARLEHATQNALEAGGVRKRLAELYRSEEDWTALAALLTTEVERAPDNKTRLALLEETARIHTQHRNDAASAVPLLEQAIQIDPDETSLRLLLAESLGKAERFDEAVTVLRAQIERYGNRKPKDRALAHFQLARVSLAAGQRAEAIAELDLANKIDPAHPGILQALARLAFQEGQLERAEKQYRALLLVLGHNNDPLQPSRAEALLDLSEIAARAGDAERAGEFIESGFEAALESEREAKAFETALADRQRYDLLGRALETRLERAKSPADAARALADLAFLHAERLGGLRSVEGKIKERATRIHHSLDAAKSADERAWAALSRVYDWLGDSAAEADVLERRLANLGGESTRSAGIDPASLYRLAELRAKDPKTVERAVEILERALELGPDVPRAEALLRSALAQGAVGERVVSLFERVVRASGDELELAKALLEVVRLPGPHVAALREASELSKKLGDKALERALFEAALRDDGRELGAEDAAWAFEQLATLEEALGRVPEALALRERAAALAPADRARALLLAVAHRAREVGDLGRAARIYADLREADPADREVWEPLCDVYRKLGERTKLSDLIKATAPLVEELSDRARLRTERAGIVLEDGDIEEATRILTEVLEEDPGQTRAADLLRGIFEKEGRIDDLIALLVTQIDTAKDRQDIPGIVAHSLRLGELLESRERSDDAFDVYGAVLEWDKSSPEVLRNLLRLAELRDDPFVVADAIEALLQVERGEPAAGLASRLLAMRTEMGDETGVERALELGFIANPTSVDLRDPLLERYTQKNDWKGASRVLRQAIAVAPNDRELLSRLVEAHRNAGEEAQALEVLEPLAEKDDSEELGRARARLYSALGRDDEALALLEGIYATTQTSVVELVEVLEHAMARAEPERERELSMRLVEVLELSGDVERARARLAELTKLAPRDADALKRLADLEARAGRWEAAAATYARLANFVNGEPLVETALLLADACERAGRIEDARAGLERALHEAPGDVNVRERLRGLYEAVGAYMDLARMSLEDAELHEDVATKVAYLLHAGALYLMPDGDPKQGLRILEDARGLMPDNVDGIVLAARAYAQNARAQEGLSLLHDVIAAHRGRRSRELSSVYHEMSRIQLTEGFLTEALQALTKAFEMDMKNARLAMELGDLALDMDEPEVAQRAYRAVTMLRPTDESPDAVTPELRAQAQFQLAVMAHRTGDARRAKVLIQKALSENPEHEQARQLLGELEGR